MSDIEWLHSGLGEDLGGNPSQFEIAVLPANNLFDNITPEEAVNGITDYRCFYIVNKDQSTNYDITLTSTAASCTVVNVGSVVQNTIQIVIFQGPSPNPNGYFIIQLDWGPELTIYWGGSYANMAANMQSQIQLVQYCSGVTVVVANIFANDTGAEFTITFAGQLINRKMGLIQIIQNNLVQSATSEYRVDDTGATPSTWNYQNTSIVQVHTPISLVPSIGLIHIPYPYNLTTISTTWPYMHLSYINYNGPYFNLASTIPTLPVYGGISSFPVLNNNDEVWVDMISPQPVNIINISMIQEGSPINQIAQVIGTELDEPLNWTAQGTNFHVGLVKPLEGFFVWVQRSLAPSVTPVGCADQFSITLNGTIV